MKINIKKIITFICLVLTISLLTYSAQAYHNKTSYKKIVFSNDDSITCIKIIKTIQSNHYSKTHLDDKLSSIIFYNFLNSLDPGKHLFLEKEIENLKNFEFQLDDTLKNGNLIFAYSAFNLYLNRTHQRAQFLLKILKSWKTKFDFTKDDKIIINKDKRSWVKNSDQLQDLWQKELKNMIIDLKLEGSTDQKISKTLKDTYENKLNYIAQITSNDAFQIFMDAVTDSFDPHTKYFAPKNFEDFDINMSLSLEGIGAMLQKENQHTKILRLIAAGPADKTKQLMPGDKIIGVGEGKTGAFKNVIGLRLDNVVKLIRGKKGTLVRLKIIPVQNKNSTKIVSIIRDKIKLEEQSATKEIKTIRHNNNTYKIGIIKLPTFYLDFAAYNNGDKNYKSVAKDVEKLLNQLNKEKIDGLIIDLRGNGGGSLSEAETLTGLFIKSGPVVQIKTKYRVLRHFDNNKTTAYRGPLVVMVNRMSASASEIFAGAIQDYHRGLIVGTQTFGKGTVQTLTPLAKGKLKLTTAKFYRISGESTQKNGILPDIELPHIYNASQIGESSLHNALPYDHSIHALYRPYPDLSNTIKQLSLSYKKRTANKPGFIYINKKYLFGEKINNLNYLSLNMKKRKSQRNNEDAVELKIVNQYLVAHKIKPVNKLSDIKEIKELQKDILLDETEIIASEFIQISKDNGYIW